MKRLVSALAFAVLCLASRRGFAQSELDDFPIGGHHAGRGPDTGGSRGYSTTVPLDLPAARGGLPVPVTLRLGGTRVGALGRGGDVQLSFISDLSTFARRRPTGEVAGPATPTRRVLLSLSGEQVELVFKERDAANYEVWAPQHGRPGLLAKKLTGVWRVYAPDGLTYTFAQLGYPQLALDLYLLDRVEGPSGAKVQLVYELRGHQLSPPPASGQTVPLAPFNATSVDLVGVLYNFGPTGSPKHEIALVYGDDQPQPLSLAATPDGVIVRKRLLSRVEVRSRAVDSGPLLTLSRTGLQYGVDPDTRLPRLESVTVSGKDGTDEALLPLPLARYEYGTATTPLPDAGTELRYEQLVPSVALPAGSSNQFISASVKSGDRYTMPQQLADVTGDGRDDFVFKTPGGLSVARNRPGANGLPVLDDVALTGPFNGGTMTKTFLDSYGDPTRLDPYPDEAPNEDTDSTTDTWTQLIDVNGDGRADFVDASEVAGKWVVYLNSPGAEPQQISWVRRELDIAFIRQQLEARGNVINSSWVPLMRQYTGARLSVERCYEWQASSGVWEHVSDGDCSPLAGPDYELNVRYEGSTTAIAWRLLDFNDDGAVDLVMQSAAPRTQLTHVLPCPSGVTPPNGPGCEGFFAHPVGDQSGTHFWALGHLRYRLAPGELDVSFNTRAPLSPFPESVPVHLGHCGPGRWGTVASERVTPGGHPYLAKSAYEDCALQDINGDGFFDSVETVGLESENAPHVAYLGNGHRVTDAYLVLPNPTGYAPIERCLDANSQPTTSGSYTTRSRTGYRDVTGDGVPDSLEDGVLRIGTGTGFAPPIRISGVNGFDLSSTQNACDLTSSRTLTGAYDVDGDGRPEQVRIVGSSLALFQLVGRKGDAPDPRGLSAGLITAIENGHGGRTEITYRSAKDDGTTLHHVPYPELVVSGVRSVQRSTGQSAETLYAYGDTRTEYDSLEGRFRSYGYGRSIAVTKVGPGRDPASPLFEGVASITDAHPLAAAANPYDLTTAFARHLIAGRPKTVSQLSGLMGDPWSLLTVNVANDPRLIGATEHEYAARTFLAAPVTGVANGYCADWVDPYAFSTVTNLDTCRTYGFTYESATSSWRGTYAPPSDANVMTHQRVLEVDDLGRISVLLAGNDARRSDDDLCVQTLFAQPEPAGPPTSWDGRVLTAASEVRVSQGHPDGRCLSLVLRRDTSTFDGLPFGRVSAGLITSRSSERRESQTGVLLDPAPIRLFDAQYDALGNAVSVTASTSDGRTRSQTTTYDAFGLVPVSSRVTATGAQPLDRTMEYDGFTLLPRGSTEPNGSRSGMTYDGYGREVLSTFAPAGSTEQAISHTSYLGFRGNDPLGRRIVEKTFSSLVALGSAAGAQGRTMTTTLDDWGRVTKAVAALGADYTNDLVVRSVTYDELGRVVFEADPFHTGQTAAPYGTTTLFNTDGTVQASIRGYGRQGLPANMFGSTNELTERYPTYFLHEFGSGQQVESVFAPDALLSGSAQNGVRHLTRSTAIGWVLTRETWSTTQRLEHADEEHDRLGNVIASSRYRVPATATDRVRWTFGFDSFGRTIRQTEPNTVQRDRVYSDWGELLSSRSAASAIGPTPGLDEERQYDGLGRLVHAQQRRGGVLLPETVYDYVYDLNQSPFALLPSSNALGRLTTVRAPTSTVYLSYDAFGRGSTKLHVDPLGEAYLERATFADDGAMTELGVGLSDMGWSTKANPKLEKVVYGYDSARRLRSAKFEKADGTGTDLFSADGVDAFGRVRTAWVAKARLSAGYAEEGRRLLLEQNLETPSGVRRGVFMAGFDPVGREKGRTEKTGTSGDPVSYEYDALGRLSRGVRTGATAWQRTLAYDALGNSAGQLDSVPGNTVLMRYATGANANLDQLCSIGYGVLPPTSCTVKHDALGNVTSMPARDGLRTLEYLPSGRVSRIQRADGTRATFKYDGLGNVQELDITGATTDVRQDRRYGIIERKSPGGGASVLLRHFPIGSMVATRRGATDTWTLSIGDERGNRFFVDAKGELAQELDYLPYGDARGAAGAAPGSPLHSSEQWNLGDNLAACGVSYLGARLYDPALGRFLSADPLVLKGGANDSNPYAFAFNDPINFTDPSGLRPECEPVGGSTEQSVGNPFAPGGGENQRPEPPKDTARSPFQQPSGYVESRWELPQPRNPRARQTRRGPLSVIAAANATLVSHAIHLVAPTPPVDWAGSLILERWLSGAGDWEIVAYGGNNSRWNAYMSANELLRKNVYDELLNVAHPLVMPPKGGPARLGTGRFDTRFVGLTGVQSSTVSGYGYLNQTNARVGGFQMGGSYNVERFPDGSYVFAARLVFVWNDMIDPHGSQDKWGAGLGKVLSLGSASDYRIKISWDSEVAIRFSANGQVIGRRGYPAHTTAWFSGDPFPSYTVPDW